MTWIRVPTPPGSGSQPVVIRHSLRQIVVFRISGRAFAIDNRCPHEGYPLASGSVSDDCVLTCNWHNWKFRLEDGECVLGGDDVRTYPTRAKDGQLWVDVSDPPLEETRKAILCGLRKAFENRDYGRIARELARLHYHGIDPVEGVRRAVEWAHDRLEFGTTHSMAATADWLAMAEQEPDSVEKRIICLAESVDHLAFDSLRRPPYPYAPPGGDSFSADAFREAVEDEDHTRAESIVGRALVDGLHWQDLEPAFAAAALEHYNDFGHSAIYVARAGELIARLGPEVERFVALPLARSICFATREDRIPEFRHYASSVEALPPFSETGAVDRPPLPFPATTAHALEWLAGHARTHRPEALYDRLLEGLALNMLAFDASYGTAHDRPVSQNVSWLDFTHGITFSSACHRLCDTYPELWRQALTQMACFLGRNRGFILEDGVESLEKWHVEDGGAFFTEVREQLLDHGLRDPIFSAHLLKTSTAAEAELTAASDSCSEALRASLNRFLNSPLKTKHARRLTRQAIALVSRDFPQET